MALPYLWFGLGQTLLRQWNYKSVSAIVISYPCHFMPPAMLFSSQILLSPLWHLPLILGRDDMVVLFKDDHSTVTCSQYHQQAWVCSNLPLLKREVLWSRLMTALVYQCKHKIFKSWFIYQKKKKIADSLLVSIISPAMDLWPLIRSIVLIVYCLFSIRSQISLESS